MEPNEEFVDAFNSDGPLEDAVKEARRKGNQLRADEQGAYSDAFDESVKPPVDPAVAAAAAAADAAANPAAAAAKAVVKQGGPGRGGETATPAAETAKA